jgi:hypothetical protein
VFVEPGPATDTDTTPATDTPPATDTGVDVGPGQAAPPVETPGRTFDPVRAPDPTPRPTPTPDRGRPRRAPELPDDDDEERDELDFGELDTVGETFENPTRSLDEVSEDITDLDFGI